MLLKFGSVISSASGSLGGHTLQNSKGGMQLRTKPISHTAGTAAQLSIRSINKVLQAGWRSLTIAQRAVWNNWPADHDIFNANGDKHPLSGHSLWMKYNFSWIQAGGEFLPDPSYWGGPILGPELIINGTFTPPTGWTTTISWSISLGKAHYLDTANSSLYRPLDLFSNVSFQLKFNISDAISSARVYFTNNLGAALFKPPYNAYSNYSNGDHILNVITNLSTSRFHVYGNILGSIFSIDNISLKKIL